MKIAKIWRKRRAVSPILAAILLIGLAVAAGAVLFVIVLPMIQSSGELSFGDVTFSDTDADGANDKVVFTLTNELTKTVSITNITITIVGGNVITNDTHTSTTFPFNIATSQSEIGITFTGLTGDSDNQYKITVYYKIGDEAQTPLVSAAYDA
ncbi:MAG: archaellin/type IV pilin N-terminal domain-containing protein [Candidatus Hodarchaeota archaeon]